MATQKPVRILYQAKNNTTGLSDVKAQVYFNGVAKAIAGTALLLTEVDSTNSPGIYELLISAATLATWGVAQGQYNCIEGLINSASHPAPSPFREEVTVANQDDIDTKLGTPAGASVSADIAAIQTKLGTPAGASVSADIAQVETNVTAIKADLETGPANLSTILSNIQSLQNASIGNGVGFVLPTMIIPTTGTNVYKIPITIFNNNGALVNATSGVTVGCVNSAGTDRGSVIQGSSGSPATVLATNDSTGQYHVMVNIASTEVEEELVFSFSYSVSGNAMVRYGVSQTLDDISTAGYALQSTLLSTQTTVNNINSVVTNATYGLSAIEAILTDPTIGLGNIESILTNAGYGLSALQNLLSNGTYGLSALQSLLTNGTYGLAALQAQSALIQGAGFVSGTDSLHALSQYLQTYLFTGGRAV